MEVALQIANKLADGWSASAVANSLSEPGVIEFLSSPDQWAILGDPEIKCRLLLAPLFLRPSELKTLRPALQSLLQVAQHDKDEWVKLTAASIGNYDGYLNFEPVVRNSQLVQSTLNDIRQQSSGIRTNIFRPLEEEYLSSSAVKEGFYCHHNTKTQDAGNTKFGSDVKNSLEVGDNTIQRSIGVRCTAHFLPRDPRKAPQSEVVSSKQAVVLDRRNLSQLHPTTKHSTFSKESVGNLPSAMPVGQGREPQPRRKSGLMARLEGSMFKSSSHKSKLANKRAVDKTLTNDRTKVPDDTRPCKKRATVIDVETVAQLNRKAAIEKEKQRQQQQMIRAEASRKKMDGKTAEKMTKIEYRAQREAEKMVAKAACVLEKEEEKKRKEELPPGKADEKLEGGKGECNNLLGSVPQLHDSQASKNMSPASPKKGKLKSKLLASMQMSKSKTKISGKNDNYTGNKHIQSISSTTAGMLESQAASAALHQAAMISNAEAAGLELDPALLQYMDYGLDSGINKHKNSH